MLIGELADTAGVNTQTIRFYVRQRLLPEPRRGSNGYRVYDDASVSRILFIRRAQAAGLTLTEIARVVGLRDDGEVPCEHVAGLLRSRLDDVRARQAELAALGSELEQLIARSSELDPDDCTTSDVCHIFPGSLHRRPEEP